jgi:hypothetical protein
VPAVLFNTFTIGLAVKFGFTDYHWDYPTAFMFGGTYVGPAPERYPNIQIWIHIDLRYERYISRFPWNRRVKSADVAC